MDHTNLPADQLPQPPDQPEKPASRKWLWVGAGLITAALVVVGIIVISLNKHPSEQASAPVGVATANTRLKGISMTPRDGSGFGELFTVAGELGQAVTWSGDWAELSKQQSGAKILVGSAKKYNLEPVILVSLHNNKEPATLLRTLTPELIDAYAADAAKFAHDNNIRYMGLGIEINNLARSRPEDYKVFTQLFNRAYDDIKKASPQTQVFTIFQLEHTKGLNGGLFGGVNDTKANTWALLDDFSKADMVGFTTYPGLIYKSPTDIPADYYSEIIAHTTKPVVFTEIGWPAGTEAAGWASTPEQQAVFIDRFFELSQSLKPRLSVWSFAYDPPAQPPFSSLGLADKAGAHRPAWDHWKAINLE